MSEITPGAMVVFLGDKNWKLQFGPLALRLAEVNHGRRYTEIQMNALTPALICEWTWVAMLPQDPDLKEEQALKWFAELDDEFTLYNAMRVSISRFMKSQRDFAAAMEQEVEPQKPNRVAKAKAK